MEQDTGFSQYTEAYSPISVWQGAGSNPYRGIYLFWLLLAGLFSLGIYTGFSEANWEFATKVATVFGLFMCVVHFWYMTRVKPVNFLAPDLIFLFAYIMFHFGYLFLWTLKIVPSSDDVFFYPRLYPKTMFVVNLGIVGFLLGYELSASKRTIETSHTIKIPTNGWTIVGLLLMVFSLTIFFVYVAIIGFETFVAKGSLIIARMEDYIPNPRLWRLRVRIFAIGFGVYSTSIALRHGRFFKGKLGLSIFAFYMLLTLLSGARTPLVISGMILLLVRHYLIKPIKLRWLAVIVVCLGFVFMGMRLFRDKVAFDIGKIASELKYAEGTDFVHWYDPFVETGSSVSTINLTMELVPLRQPYWRGRSYLQTVIHIVPYLQGTLGSGLGLGPAQWLTWTTKGPDAAGTGFSIAGEGYLNFGLVGVLFQMVFMGFVLRRIYAWFISTMSPGACLVFFVSFGIFAMSVRNHVSLVITPLFQVIVFAWLLKKLCGEIEVSASSSHMPVPQIEDE